MKTEKKNFVTAADFSETNATKAQHIADFVNLALSRASTAKKEFQANFGKLFKLALDGILYPRSHKLMLELEFLLKDNVSFNKNLAVFMKLYFGALEKDKIGSYSVLEYAAAKKQYKENKNLFDESFYFYIENGISVEKQPKKAKILSVKTVKKQLENWLDTEKFSAEYELQEKIRSMLAMLEN